MLPPAMPYAEIQDLPLPLRRHLPEAAQELFLRAFNGAWRSYADRPLHEREVLANRVAWSVVKRRYRKIDGEWCPYL